MWAHLKAEGERILLYLILLLAAKGGISLVPGPGLPPIGAPPPAPELPAPPPPRPAPPPAVPPALPKVDPEQSIVRITSGGAGCTATIIGPSPREGYQVALSAAHCVRSEGVSVRLYHKSGKTYDGFVYKRHAPSDLSLIVFRTRDKLDYAKIAEKAPAEGTPIWHMGYGVDRPGNKEVGVVVRAGSEKSFTNLKISVSSGDSGCGFFRTDNGELIGTCYGVGGGYTIGPGVDAIRAFLRSVESAAA